LIAPLRASNHAGLPVDYPQLVALFQVILIDIVLAGDNAVVVGMAAARVDPRLRAKVIFWGVGGAVVLRIAFAVVATQLLAIVGLLLAGGILLLWVCWKMYRDIKAATHAMEPAFAGGVPGGAEVKTITFSAALMQIVIADASMSLDNVLAVAGAAKGDTTVLVIGLVVAVAFMGFLSHYIARLLTRHIWISWIGLAIILYVAADMIWSGTHQVGCQFVPANACQAGAFATLQTLL
jgi:YjbE family integral membrane protein